MNAPDKALEIKAAIAAVVAVVTSLLGWTGIAVVILLICIVLDYITGTWAAKSHGEWSSERARQGLWHKLGEIVALCVAALCDVALGVVLSSAASAIFGNVPAHGWVTLIVSVWYIITELGSILENAAKLGAPIPRALIEGIGRLKKKVDKQELIPKEERQEDAQPSLPAAAESESPEDESTSDD